MPCVEHRLLRDLEHTVFFEGCYIVYDGNKRNDNSSNSNSEIIALYKKGISILEISKMLSIGQGEVKLVVDLYNAR